MCLFSDRCKSNFEIVDKEVERVRAFLAELERDMSKLRNFMMTLHLKLDAGKFGNPSGSKAGTTIGSGEGTSGEEGRSTADSGSRAGVARINANQVCLLVSFLPCRCVYSWKLGNV